MPDPLSAFPMHRVLLRRDQVASLFRPSVLIVGLLGLLVASTPPATAAEPPSQAELAVACHRTVARASVRIVHGQLKRTRSCLEAWDKCDALAADDERCRERARRTCTRAGVRLERERVRQARAIAVACGAVTSETLLEAHGLAYGVLADVCLEQYGEPLTDADGIGACLIAQHECYAQAILDTVRSSASAAGASVAADLAVVGCPPRFDDTASLRLGASIGARCANRLANLVTETLFKRLQGLQQCGTRLLRCDLAATPDAQCAGRAIAWCRARLARIAGRAEAKRERLIARCDAGGTRAESCDDAERAGATVSGAATCLGRRAECWASELLQFEAPRGHALLDAGTASLLGDGCAPETLPTILPPQAQGPFGGAGPATPTPTSTAQATAIVSPTSTPLATPTTSATPTMSATPTPTATPTPVDPPCVGYALAVDPTNADVLYTAVRDRGLFKNTTGGRAPWMLLGLQGTHINELAINPDNPQVLYAGTEGAGVLRSTSGGARFDVTGLFAVRDADRVRALALDPQAPNLVYAGTRDAGVVRSTSSGNRWEVTSLLSLPGGASVRALAVSPISSATVVAGVLDGGTYTTRTRGRSWSFTSLASFVRGRSVLSLAINPENGATVYAGTATGDIFRSIDGGNAWTPTNFAAFGSGRPRAIAIDVGNASVLYASRDGDIDKSPNRGATWQATTFAARAGQTLVCDIVAAPSAVGTLYAATNDGRVFKSTDAGASWTEATAGL